MFVSNGKKSWIRVTVLGNLHRNGSFIDIFWKTSKGKTRWIGILEKDIRDFLISGKNVGTISVEFDERIK